MGITELILKRGIDKLVVNNKAEYITSTPRIPLSQFYKYILVYSLIFPDNKLAKHWDVSRKGLEKVLKGVPMYEIEMPYEYNLEVFEEILKFVERGHA